MGTTAAWYEDRIAAAVAPLLPGFTVEAVAEIDSTNTELMRRARAGLIPPVLLVAERQTAGRGRLGRPWQSAQQGGDDAASLTFSLGLPLAPRDWSGLSLAVGVSVAESLDPSGDAKVALKWPNDLWVDDRKLAGILIETAMPHAARAEGLVAAPRYLVIALPRATRCADARFSSATAASACAKVWPGVASCRCALPRACRWCRATKSACVRAAWRFEHHDETAPRAGRSAPCQCGLLAVVARRSGRLRVGAGEPWRARTAAPRATGSPRVDSDPQGKQERQRCALT
jgi:hypothetical protein